jgi:hypothetical protein
MEHDQEEYGLAFETDVQPQIVDDSTDFDERKPDEELFL